MMPSMTELIDLLTDPDDKYRRAMVWESLKRIHRWKSIRKEIRRIKTGTQARYIAYWSYQCPNDRMERYGSKLERKLM